MSIIYDPAGADHIDGIIEKACQMAAIAGETVVLVFNGRKFNICASHKKQALQMYDEIVYPPDSASPVTTEKS